MANKITIANLNALITANATQFLSELGKVQTQSSKTASFVNSALSSIGVGLSLTGLAAMSKSIIDFGSHIVDLSEVASMGAQPFQTLSALAAESGVQMEQVAKASENLRSKLQDAATDGAGPLAYKLRDLGLEAKALQELAPEKQWVAFAKALDGATDKQAALNTLSEVFGAKIGPKLKQVLDTLATKDWKDIEKSMKGIRIDDEQLKMLDEAGDQLERIGTALKVIGANVLTKSMSFMDKFGSAGAMAGTVGGSMGGSGWHVTDNGYLVKGGAGEDNRSGYFGNTGVGHVSKPIAGVDEMVWAKALASEREMNDRKGYGPVSAADADNLMTAKYEGQRLADDRYRDRIAAMKDIPVTDMFNDRLSRIGLLTGPGGSEVKKQTSLLQNMLDELKKANTSLRRATAVAAASYA